MKSKTFGVFKKIDRVMDWITRIFAYVACLALFFNVVITIAYIISRFTGKAIVGSEEMVAFAQVVVISFAFGFTHFNHGLVHVGFFMKKLPKALPMAAWIIDNWISAIICVTWVYVAFNHLHNVRQISQMLFIPYKPFYTAVAIGVAIYALSQVYEAIKCTVAIFDADLRTEVKANWPA